MANIIGRGIHLPMKKEPAASRSIENIKSVSCIFVPLAYGEARLCRPAVERGATVSRGDILGKPEHPQDSPALAPVNGVFLDTQTLQHPVCGTLTGAVLSDITPAALPRRTPEPVDKLRAADVLAIARRAGVIDELDGMPLHEKLAAWRGGCTVLVANGVEAEPYASSAWAVLNEYAEQVKSGLELAARAVEAARAQVAVRLPGERRRPLAQRLGEDTLYAVRGSRYPVTKFADAAPRETVCCIGVQACLALYRAAAFGEGHCSCVVTVAGDAVATPKNVRVPFGTPVMDVLMHCGLAADPSYILLGDALTGVTATAEETPLLAGITCVLALTARTVAKPGPCMGCGRCAQVCHAGLLPYEIVRRLENMHYERLASLLPEECDGCGACSYICPMGREVTAHVLEAGCTGGTMYLNWGDDEDA